MESDIDIQGFFDWVIEVYGLDTALDWVDYFNSVSKFMKDPDVYVILREMIRKKTQEKAGPGSPNQMIGGWPGDGENRLI